MRHKKSFPAPVVLPDPAPVAVELGPNLCNLSCHYCGHCADIGEFWTVPVNGDLPPGDWQCPQCHRAWRIVKTPLDKFGPNQILPIPSYL